MNLASAKTAKKTTVKKTGRRSLRAGLWVFLAVLVVAAAAWFMVTAAKRKDEYASRALDEARSAAEQGNIGAAVQGFGAPGCIDRDPPEMGARAAALRVIAAGECAMALLQDIAIRALSEPRSICYDFGVAPRCPSIDIS